MRGLRTLGVTTALVLAFVAFLGVSTAAASKLTSTAYPLSVSGEGSAASWDMEFGVLSTSVGCTRPSISATLSAATDSITASPGEATCTFYGQKKVDWKGCSFNFKFGSDAGHFGRYDGTLDIGPAGCGPIKISENLCTFSILPQTGLAVSYENVGQKVLAIVDAKGVKYTASGPLCANNPGTLTNGTLRATWTLSSQSAYPLFVEEDPHTPSFEAESYPASASGSQIGRNVFEGGGGKAECTNANYATSASVAASTVTITPTYSECVAAGFKFPTIATNGCTYDVSVGAKIAAGKYSGSADVICPAGKSIVINAVSICELTIPAQTGLTGTVEFVNEPGDKVRANAALTGIDFTLTSAIWCPLQKSGSYTNGKFTGSVMMEGSGGNGIRVGG